MKNDKGMKQKLFVCDCGDISHQFVVSWYPEDKDWNDLLYFQVHLNQSYSFWKRLWIGLKYIFGYRCCFGAFDEILLNKEKAELLKYTLEKFLSVERDPIPR